MGLGIEEILKNKNNFYKDSEALEEVLSGEGDVSLRKDVMCPFFNQLQWVPTCLLSSWKPP